MYYNLQAGTNPPDGWFVLWTKGNGIFPFHTTDIAGMAHKIGELQQITNVYVGMALQRTKPEPGKRGTGANSAAIFGVWTEIDCQGGKHHEQALPTKEQALALLKGLPLVPTVILDSGGGFHCHWWLDAPLVFTTDDERQHGQDLVCRFQEAVAEVFRQQGFKVDTTSDLARVLRPPHTLNHKYGTPGQHFLVTVIHYDESLRYSVAEIDAVCQPAPPPPAPRLPSSAVQSPLSSVAGQDAAYPPAEFEPIINGCAWLRHCRDDAATLPEPEWFAALSIVARCEDGNNHAHAISAAYSDYTHSATEAKIAHALSGGPRTCANIQGSLNAAAYCAACPHHGKASSPIVLGFPKSTHAAPVPIHSMIPDAPVSPQALVPGRLVLSIQRGIENLKDDGKGNKTLVQLFPVPLVIVERLKCVNTDREEVKISWMMDGFWHFQIVDRKVIADTRDVVSLASVGLPITSKDKDFIVEYFREYDKQNRFCIPLIQVASRFGWQQGQEAFLWGRTLITKDDVHVGSHTGTCSVVFKGGDDGDEQVADGFYYAGDFDIWRGIANRALVHPIPLVILIAACAPPLLSIIGASNFVVETAGTTSTGKTSVQRLAASVWGCPDERAEASCLHTWDTTRVWVERVGGLLDGLPLILDDTKRVFSSLPKDQARTMVNSVIYAYASGKGRGRGSVQGTQAHRRFPVSFDLFRRATLCRIEF